ncbi:MAG: hypothetical protein ACOX6W_08895 [Lentisphaeria bacterium]
MTTYHLRNRDTGQPCVQALRRALGGGRDVYVVGKGPSLDELAEADFAEYPDAPILCVNEAVHAVERLDLDPSRLFCVQYDRLPRCNRPARATWLLSSYAYGEQGGAEAGAVRYDLDAIAPHKPNLTASTALSIAALAGANHAFMLAFDAAFPPGDCGYAASVSHGPELVRQHPRRFVHFADKAIPARAAEEGVRLTWQTPRDFWLVALVLRSGGQYDLRHVEAIAGLIGRNLQTPHGIVLLTDVPGDASAWRSVRLAHDWPGWFAKLELFRPDLGWRGGVLFTDLDNYFGRPFTLPRWDTLKPGALYMPRDPYRDMWISALMAWRMGSVAEPYSLFRDRPVTRHPGNRVHSDQEVVNEAMAGRIETLEWLATASYKAHHPQPDGVDCVLFHGHPKPWDVGLVPGLPPSTPEPRKPQKPVGAVRPHDPRATVARFLKDNPQFARTTTP